MIVVLIAVIVVLGAALAAVAALTVRHRRSAGRRPPRLPVRSDCRRILFPFVASALSRRALDAALRLARAEDATLVPVFLARVPLHLPLDAPLPRQSARGDARCRRRSSTGRSRSGSPSTPGSRAGAATATRCARRSPASASTGS